MKYRALIASAWGIVSNVLGPGTTSDSDFSIRQASRQVDHLIQTFKSTVGAPGIAVCVSVGGKTFYSKGFGYADVEQGVKVIPHTKFRIASISKSFTSLLVGRMIDQGRLDLDADIKTYLPDFVPKTQKGMSSPMSMRHLLSHTSGIRHYRKAGEEISNENEYTPEMLISTAYDSANEALSLFRNDELFHLPGEDYLYSTHGYTLAAAVVEAILAKGEASLFERPARLKEKKDTKGEGTKNVGETGIPDGVKSGSLLKQLIVFLRLHDTCLDEPNKIIPFRARPYRRDPSNGFLVNAPSVDTSYKWSGGGILSTAPDLIQMANHLVQIYMGYYEMQEYLAVVSRRTLVNSLWFPVRGTVQGAWLPGGLYGLGWFVARRSTVPMDKVLPADPHDRLYVGHTGGAVGYTSVLLLSLPVLAEREQQLSTVAPASEVPPICVAVLVNQDNASGIGRLAIQITEVFTSALRLSPEGLWASTNTNAV